MVSVYIFHLVVDQIHSNSNFGYITNANITAINEKNKIDSISKVTILNDLIKE